MTFTRRSAVKRLVLAALASAALGGAALAQEKVTISYAMWDAAQVPAMQQIIAEFNETHPNIEVKIQVTPWDDYWTKLQTSATGGSAPDVFWMTLAYFKLYASNGVLLPLDEQIASESINMADYVPAMAQAYKYDDVQYGMPKDVNAFGLFYNKDLFTAAGVPFPDATWTWQNVIDAAQKLTDPATGVYGVGAQETDELAWYLTVPQTGGYVLSDDGKSSGYDKPETVAGIQFWVDLVNKYKVSPNLQQLTDTEALALFTSGKLAMYYGGSWDPVAIADVPAAKAFTDVAPLPKGPKGGKFYSNGLAYSIYAGTKHPKEAWAFVSFLGSKRANEIQATTGTVIPAYNGQAGGYIKALSWMNAQALIDQLPEALPFPVSENTPIWRRNATAEFAKAWTGKETVEAVAARVAAQMNEAVAAE
ncbi:sugar ABC transporter substrate-binding protein [Rhizobium sp. BK251]|uniref:ABC transporter substrate-binding protein n=1 Tax=Rhizobium sp. BK251 TaxID=2512125 RepID=UPI00140506CC|nr:sugar ABC transporter substrate-binding protein [Rhizobium sp. BK251]